VLNRHSELSLGSWEGGVGGGDVSAIVEILDDKNGK
jgi:hypothetical protein